MNSPTSTHGLDLAREVLRIEAQEVESLAYRLDGEFLRAVDLILHCPGRVVVSGMGKSGHIGRKIAATFASTGTPSFFMHPAEASHGDLGMVTASDILLALSYSGESAELLSIVPLLKRIGCKVISVTGDSLSTLAKEADIHLEARVSREACSLGLAPTASTTTTLALGDALAVTLLDARGFSAEDFARSHPGGTLGRRLLVHVSDVMRSGEWVPRVSEEALLLEALAEMTRTSMGMVAIVDANEIPQGIFTDGDLRRLLQAASRQTSSSIQSIYVRDTMHRNPALIQPGRLAVEAVEMMESKRISQLLVVDEHGRLIGALNMHDLLKAKVI